MVCRGACGVRDPDRDGDGVGAVTKCILSPRASGVGVCKINKSQKNDCFKKTIILLLFSRSANGDVYFLFPFPVEKNSDVNFPYSGPFPSQVFVHL